MEVVVGIGKGDTDVEQAYQIVNHPSRWAPLMSYQKLIGLVVKDSGINSAVVTG